MFTARAQRRIADTVRGFERLDKTSQRFQKREFHNLQGHLAGVVGSGGITGGTYGIVNITDNLGATIKTLNEVYLDRVGIQDPATADLVEGTNVFVAWFKQDKRWRVVCADCPAEPAAAPPGHGDIVEASTTQTQAGAEALSYSVNRITVCDNDYDSVKLPDAVLEEHCYVMNDTDNILQVWADTDNRFTKQGPNSSVWIPARTGVDFQCVRANTWIDPRGHDTAGRTFDGTDDYISLSSGSIPTTWTSADFTLFFDCLDPCTVNDDYIFSHGGGTNRFQVYINSGKLHVGGQAQGVWPGNLAMQAARYLIQYDTAETGFARWKVWIDGTLQTNTTTGSYQAIASTTNPFHLGAFVTPSNYSAFKMRDVRFWNGLVSWSSAMSEETTNLGLWWHLNDASSATAARDVSGSGRDGTYTGTTRYEP